MHFFHFLRHFRQYDFTHDLLLSEHDSARIFHGLPQITKGSNRKKRKFHFFQTLYDDINFCAVPKCFGELKGMLWGLQKRQ